jgi:hypothetical protein
VHRTKPTHCSVRPSSILKLVQGHGGMNWPGPSHHWLARTRLGTVLTVCRRRPPVLHPDHASCHSDVRHLPPGLHVPMAYKLDLPLYLVGVHDIFHMSQLKKCLKAPADILLPEVTPLEADLSYPKHPIKVLDQKDHLTRCKKIKFFKIQCSNHSEEEATWEIENFLCSCHQDFELPQGGNMRLLIVPIEAFLFPSLRTRFLLEGRAVTRLASL